MLSVFRRLREAQSFRYAIFFLVFLFLASITMLFLEGEAENGSGFEGFFESLWFAIVTVTTVGYGDMSPVSPIGRIAAVIIMFVGTGFLGVLTGNITTWLVEKNRRKSLGLEPLRGLSNHILICGWKSGMESLIKGILSVNPKLSSQQVVLINDADYHDVNDLRRFEELQDFHFIHGDHSERGILEQCCIEKASTALIIAEKRSDKTEDEIDARTIISALTLESLNDHIFTCAELLSAKVEPYLQGAKVEEIVTTDLYTRNLLCNIAVTSGLYNVFKELFDFKEGVLKILPIPSEYLGRSFQELQGECLNEENLVIGLLGNIGNIDTRKREKLREAQKVPSIREAIQEVMAVKSMKGNLPFFCPDPDHVISKYSNMIVVARAHNRMEEEERKRRHVLQGKSKKPFFEGRLIICGWKKNMSEMVGKMLELKQNHNTNWKEIYVVAKVPDSEAEVFERHFAELPEVALIRGDYIENKNLICAGIKQASKVLIISEDASHRTLQEIDSRTMIAAMAVEDLNKQAYKVAEIQDSRYVKYLGISHVEEIVTEDKMNRVLLSYGCNGEGMVEIIRTLINKACLETIPVPREFVGKEYQYLQDYFTEQRTMCIGLIEQSGSYFVRKSKSIQEAQVNPTIQASVEHLQGIKSLITNEVVIAPPKNYVVDVHSMLIRLSNNRD